MTARSRLTEICVHILVVLFGLSSWIAINGLWAETPIIVNVLPEGWKLTSYMVVVTHFANLGPLIYSILLRWFPRSKLEPLTINVINGIGVVSLILLMFVWDTVTPVFGANHSVAFLVLTFFLAFVDDTSTVLYIPYLSNISSRFMTSHLIGQSMSGLIPSLVALIQGVGKDADSCPSNSTNVTQLTTGQASDGPLFSVERFFLIMAGLATISWVSFILLSSFECFKIRDKREDEWEEMDDTIDTIQEQSKSISTTVIYSLFSIELIIAFIIFGILPAIQPFSVAMFGSQIYHLAVTLSAIASPIGTLAGSFLSKLKILPFPLLGAFACFFYILTSALHSPARLLDTNPGKWFILFAWIGNNFFFSFSRASIVRILRRQHNSHRILYLGGAFQQMGSFIGSVCTFFVVNYTDIFVSYHKTCP